MPPLDSIARIAVAALLLWAAGAKLSAGRDGTWLSAYRVPVPMRRPLAVALALAEAVVGALLLAGVRGAAFAALGLGTLFVLALADIRRRGVRRVSCGCFGAKDRGTSLLIGRAFAFTSLAALAALGAPPAPSRDAAVLFILGVLALAVVALAVLVLALYRQVGVLTMRLGPSVALELEEEGPALGAPAPALDGLARRGAELVAFFTADCRLCRELAPAVRALGREGLPVHVVYEGEEPEAFERWRVPGAPFAVHVIDGAVAAKGTVNTLEQLAGLIATGSVRMEHAPA